jgi:hypothetical protein
MIKVTVTAAHISAAKYPRNSPIALALREMGYADAHVTHLHAYIANKVYALPQEATVSERQFDYLAKGGSSQGEISEEIKPYEFEMEELRQ